MAHQVTESGMPLVELENGWWLPDGAAWLGELYGSEGSRTLTPAKHRKCPGHAAAVREADGGYEVAYLCLDPVGQGHIDQRRDRHIATEASSDGPGMTEEQKAERRRVVTNNKAWEVAAPVRREYVTELLARRAIPKGPLRYVTDVIMADPAGIAAGDGDRVASLIGKETHPGSWDRSAAITLARDASDARLPLVLLAQVAASVEARFGERQGWRHPTPALMDYLRFLATCGYGLSEVEQEVADGSEGDE